MVDFDECSPLFVPVGAAEGTRRRRARFRAKMSIGLRSRLFTLAYLSANPFNNATYILSTYRLHIGKLTINHLKIESQQSWMPE